MINNNIFETHNLEPIKSLPFTYLPTNLIIFHKLLMFISHQIGTIVEINRSIMVQTINFAGW